MRLKIVDNIHIHSDSVPCLAWSSANELYSLGDDQKLIRWSKDGSLLGLITNCPLFQSLHTAGTPKDADTKKIYYTTMNWTPGKSDILALGSADGKLVLSSRFGLRIDKIVNEAHHGAILAVTWSSDAGTILTAGEDGVIKIWSKTGMLRSTLVTQSSPVFAAVWSSDGSQVLFTTNQSLSVKPLQPGSKTNSWRAHEGIVLCLSWNETNDLIVSGSEDKKYKVWDAFGRLIYSSQMLEHPITSVSWSLSGEYFAVGSFNTIRVCDQQGWTFAAANLESGSLLQLAWMEEGNSLAYASATGHIGFTYLVEQKIEWRDIEVLVVNEKLVSVRNVKTGNEEQVDIKDRLCFIGIAFNTIIILTSGHVHVFAFGKSLVTFDLPTVTGNNGSSTASSNTNRIACFRQCKTCFAIVNSQLGIVLINYFGKVLCTIKLPSSSSLNHNGITKSLLALNNELVCIRDPSNQNQVLTYDIRTGKLIQTHTHSTKIREISLDQIGNHMCLVDVNNDLYITQTNVPTLTKLSGMTDSIEFAEDSPVLSAIIDSQLVFFMYPGIVLQDAELGAQSRLTRALIHPNESTTTTHHQPTPRISWFSGSLCSLRRMDGSYQVMAFVCPYTRLLHDLCACQKWESAISLCRKANTMELWTVLAGRSANANELNAAQVAYAAINAPDKVRYLEYVSALNCNELKSAEWLVFKKKFMQAESILLASNHAYLAIRMWMDLHQWDRALEIAKKFSDYLPVVIMKRANYLSEMGIEEKNSKFLQPELSSCSHQLSQDQILTLIENEDKKFGLLNA